MAGSLDDESQSEKLILVTNPGSASRKYALFRGRTRVASLHFEFVDGKIVGHLATNGDTQDIYPDVADMLSVTAHIVDILVEHQLIAEGQTFDRIGLRVVAPSSGFLRDRLADDETVRALEDLMNRAPIHISATLAEIRLLRASFPDTPIVCASDSSFHASKPDFAWNYAVPLDDTDRFEIKRFGYHGLSLESIVRTLESAGKLAPRIVVCHLGSGASVTAIQGGKGYDTTMGFSPLEGVVMSTRCGNIGVEAALALRDKLGMSDVGLREYLNYNAGLKGLGGSDDIRELVRRESQGDFRAKLALGTYVHSLQKAIGEMTACLGGIDVLVFTGTVGERSYIMRERILDKSQYLDIKLDPAANNACIDPASMTVISAQPHSKPVFVIPTDETAEIARHAHDFQL